MVIYTDRKEADETKRTNLGGGYALADEIRRWESSPRDSRRRRNHHENFCRGCHCNVHAAAFPVSANQRKIRVAEEKRIARNDGDVLASGGCGEEKLKKEGKEDPSGDEE